MRWEQNLQKYKNGHQVFKVGYLWNAVGELVEVGREEEKREVQSN